ncbi:MAG: hypothetical protein QM737_11385 [Ferruginibacter sp.]
MNIDKKISTDTDATAISPAERKLLDESFDITGDDLNLKKAALDHTDNDGELLNEESSADDISGHGLDIPGEADDDAEEFIGKEDEENSGYSEADTE